MNAVLENIAAAWAMMSGWEALAVLLSVTYLLLAMRQNNLCWVAAFVSTAIFTVLFWDVSLLMNAALHLYYLWMAVFGWWSWRKGSASQPLRIQRWSWQRHVIVISAVGIITLISGYVVARYTQGAAPYLDAFTTIGAMVTTYMVTRKVLENWPYWLVVDSAALYLYADRGLYLTALLMAVYLVIVVFGWFKWSKEYRQQSKAPHAG